MYDVFGLGNALVDTEINVEDGFLDDHNLTKSHTSLIDDGEMQTLLDDLAGSQRVLASGGSAANTIFSIQAFGHSTAYACRVGDDDVGHFFLNEMREHGVDLNPSAVSPTGRSGECLVLITPDAERTMNTNLGISAELGLDQVELSKVAQSRFAYLEGYLSSSPTSAAAASACRSHALQHGVHVALTLSDPSMVQFFKTELTEILGDGVQIIFCNDEEALAWANTDRLDVAIAELKDIAPELYVTLGAEGSLAIVKGHQSKADGYATTPVDTTGAGDIYAGAVLAARCDDAAPLDAARFANYAAARLVAQYGARLKTRLEHETLRTNFVNS